MRLLFSHALKAMALQARDDTFPKGLRFVTTLVILGQRPQPGIVTTNRIWPQHGASLLSGIPSESCRWRLLKEVVQPGLHVFVRVLLTVDALSVRDDRP